MPHLLPAQFPKKALAILIVLFIGFLALGFHGWSVTLREASGHDHWNEALSRTIDLVTGEEAVVVSDLHEPHWTLLVAKWGIKALLAAAIFQSAIFVFRRQWRKWRFRKVHGHHVYAGLGAHNRDLAMQALKSGVAFAVIDPDEHHPDRANLEGQGGLFLCGNPGDRELLRAAGVARAGRLIIGAGDDAANVAVAEQAASVVEEVRLGREVEILVPIDSVEMRELLRERWALLAREARHRVRLVGYRSVALRHVLTRLTRELASVPHVRQAGPRILVVADLDFAAEFLDLAAPFVQISGTATPRFSLCGVDPVGAQGLLLRYPDIGRVATVQFIEESAFTIHLAEKLDGQSFDLAVVHLGSESASLAAAERLLRSPRFRVPKVIALVDTVPVIQIQPDPQLEVMALFEHGTRSQEFGDTTLEKLARENHEAYVAGLEPAEKKTAPSWAALPEAFKDSNRWAVLHREIKQSIWNSAAENEKPALLEMLACSEHQRWMAEKIMDGWRGGATRDNFRKVHPDIRPFADLSEPAKEKDRVQVRKALGL
jgi:voltage-gated potassium channel Kch